MLPFTRVFHGIQKVFLIKLPLGILWTVIVMLQNRPYVVKWLAKPISNKHSVLRRQSRYKSKYKKVGVLPMAQYGLYSLTFQALALRQRETAVSLWRRANAWNVKLYNPYWAIGSTPTFLYFDLYLLCLRSTLCLFEMGFASHFTT